MKRINAVAGYPVVFFRKLEANEMTSSSHACNCSRSRPYEWVEDQGIVGCYLQQLFDKLHRFAGLMEFLSAVDRLSEYTWEAGLGGLLESSFRGINYILALMPEPAPFRSGCFGLIPDEYAPPYESCNLERIRDGWELSPIRKAENQSTIFELLAALGHP